MAYLISTLETTLIMVAQGYILQNNAQKCALYKGSIELWLDIEILKKKPVKHSKLD